MWPTVGWSNWFGINTGPRPGGQCIRYFLVSAGASGVATQLNTGLFVEYNNLGSIETLVYEGGPLPFSLEPVRLTFKRSFPDIENWVVDLSLGIWLDDFGIPLEWAETTFMPPQPARIRFEFPPLGPFVAGLVSGNVPNEVEIIPVNDNGLNQWNVQP